MNEGNAGALELGAHRDRHRRHRAVATALDVVAMTTTQKHRLRVQQPDRRLPGQRHHPGRWRDLAGGGWAGSLGALALAGAGDATASAANLARQRERQHGDQRPDTGRCEAVERREPRHRPDNTNSGWAAGATALDLFGAGCGLRGPEQRRLPTTAATRGLRRLGQQRAGLRSVRAISPSRAPAQSLLRRRDQRRTARGCGCWRRVGDRRATRPRARTPRRSTTWRRRATRLR